MKLQTLITIALLAGPSLRAAADDAYCQQILTSTGAGCAPAVEEMVFKRTVHSDAKSALAALRAAGGGRAARALVSSALAVVDDLPAGAYAAVVDGVGVGVGGGDPRVKQVRRFLRYVLDREVMSGRDWREVLAQVPTSHVLPLMDALVRPPARFGRARAPQTWLAGLHFPEHERLALGARLIAEQLPLATVRRWTDLADPRAWSRLEDRMTPLQWLEYAAWTDVDLGRRVVETERRAATFGDARPPRGVIGAPLAALIEDESAALPAVSRIYAALAENWTRWYGAHPVLPPLTRADRPSALAARLQIFYGRTSTDAAEGRRESRRIARRFRAEQAARPARDAAGVRLSLEAPFRDFALNVDDQRPVFLTIRRTLAEELPRTKTPADWIHLAETAVPRGFEESQRAFLIARIPDLIRTGDARLDFLDHAAEFSKPHLRSFSVTSQVSTLGKLREFRDGVAPAARGETALGRRAIERVLGPQTEDDAALTPLMLNHLRRPLLEYLRGRSLAGARPRLSPDEWARLRVIVAGVGYRLVAEHVDASGGVYVRVDQNPVQ